MLQSVPKGLAWLIGQPNRCWPSVVGGGSDAPCDSPEPVVAGDEGLIFEDHGLTLNILKGRFRVAILLFCGCEGRELIGVAEIGALISNCVVGAVLERVNALDIVFIQVPAPEWEPRRR